MHLKPNVPFRVIRLAEIGSGDTVDPTLKVIPHDHDPVGVPFPLFEGSLGSVGADRIGAGQAAPPDPAAGLVVEVAGVAVDRDLALRTVKPVGRQRASGTLWLLPLFGEMAADLNPGVEFVIDLDLELQFEILQRCLGGEERVWAPFGRGADKDAVDYRIGGGAADDPESLERSIL